MNIEEFAKLGCYKCGSHNFEHPISEDFIACTDCSKTYALEFIGNLDSMFWEQLEAEAHGVDFEPIRTVQFKEQQEEEFVSNFVASVSDITVE